MSRLRNGAPLLLLLVLLLWLLLLLLFALLPLLLLVLLFVRFGKESESPGQGVIIEGSTRRLSNVHCADMQNDPEGMVYLVPPALAQLDSTESIQDLETLAE
jgi:hypothetical protein